MSSPDATENAAADDPAGQLWQLWCQGQQPDVEAFLAQAGPLSPDEVAAVLRVDQRRRWQAGERILAETYLQQHPEVRANPDAAVDLIFNEFLVRDRLGDRPVPEEYLLRFPEHAGCSSRRSLCTEPWRSVLARASVRSRRVIEP